MNAQTYCNSYTLLILMLSNSHAQHINGMVLFIAPQTSLPAVQLHKPGVPYHSRATVLHTAA
jgi:hypothetical protein